MGNSKVASSLSLSLFSFFLFRIFYLFINYFFWYFVKHGKGSKNSSAYFNDKMIEEEEMEKQIDDGTFDECAYVKDDDDLCA